MTLLQRPLFYVGGHYVTVLGLIAFVGFFAAGVIIARFLQSQIVRRSSQPVQDRHKLHRDRHDDPGSGGDCLFHGHGGECCGNSVGLDRTASGNHSEPRSSFPADRVIGGGVLVFLGDETFSFQPAACAERARWSCRSAVAQVVSNIVLVVGIFFVLENAGIHFAALAVFAGAVGVGVGFGLQNIASNFISGLVIVAERPITIGDRVEVAGILGTVRQIRARSTVIVTNDNIAIIVPNSKFIDSPVTNWQYRRPECAVSSSGRRGLWQRCEQSA